MNDNFKWVEVIDVVICIVVNNVDGLFVFLVDDVEMNEELVFQIVMDLIIEILKEFDEKRVFQKVKFLSCLRNEFDVDIVDVLVSVNGFLIKMEGMREMDD